MADLEFEAVSEKLQELLEAVDVDSTTTKDIFRLLTESLGNGVKRFKKEIRAAIATYFAEKESKNESESKSEERTDCHIQLGAGVFLDVCEQSKPASIEIYDKRGMTKSVDRIRLSGAEFLKFVEALSDATDDTGKEICATLEDGRNIVVKATGKGETDITVAESKKDSSARVTIRLTEDAKRALEQHKDTVLEKIKSELSTKPTSRGKKRRLADGDKSTTSVPKSKKLASSDHVMSIELDSNVFVTVSEFKGRMRADLRRYYIDKETKEPRPTQKGLSMDKEQFTQLFQNIHELKKAVAEKNAKFFLEIGRNRRASVSDFTGRLLIDLREFFQPKSGGDLKPGKKGISFDPRVLDVLSEKGESIMETLN